MDYPKRLIEVDLPIARISAHARREKSIRHGHISTLHIWWARRPLAACRAVILASLWPDPVDLTEWLRLAEQGGQTGPMGPEIRAPLNESLKPGEGVVIRPNRFLDEARAQMKRWSRIGVKEGKHASGETIDHLLEIQSKPDRLNHPEFLRAVLLDFIADFANWDNSTDADYLATSRALVQAAHEALGGEPGTRPLVFDPFAGGGSIPLEALRVGADAFASDLNPIPVLLNKVVLEYIPKYGQRLADEVRKWGRWVKDEAGQELAEFYPNDSDGSTPIAYLWARTVLSEAPGQGTIPIELPLLRSLWLAKKKGRQRALRWTRDENGKVKTQTIETVQYINATPTSVRVKRPLLEVFEPRHDSEVEDGTVSRGHATCPVTNFTTRVDRVRIQLADRNGGTRDSRLIAVVSVRAAEQGRYYRVPLKSDIKAANAVRERVDGLQGGLDTDGLPLIPDERFTGIEPRRIPLPQYGMRGFGDLFAPRQLLTIVTICRLIRQVADKINREDSGEFSRAVATCLAFVVDRMADGNSSLARWQTAGEKISNTFGRQALPMVWDYCEANPFCDATRSLDSMIEWVAKVCEHEHILEHEGHVAQSSASSHPLPDDAAALLCTDPPYYYSVPYADLSDFFYIWLRRCLAPSHPSLFAESLTPKEQECVQNLPHSKVAHLQKSRQFYERMMTASLADARRVTRPDGFGLIVFAHSDTEAWEALLAALVDAGWNVTSSWPIDTEMQSRILAQRQSTLASSVHICCRPREAVSGALLESHVGEWRDVLEELPIRIRTWMPRLAAEGVVGADAIFACLGPALEIFTRYSRVEKASGEAVMLREYLEQVWAAVSNEALSMIFKDADAAGLEPNARITAMWLWTLGTGQEIAALSLEGPEALENEVAAADDEDDTDAEAPAKAARAGFELEFDAARKIAQGLGVHLEQAADIVEVKGDTARLLPVAERIRHLFGKDATQESTGRGRKKKQPQRGLFEELEAIEAQAESSGNGRFGGLDAAKPGTTVLDKVHQSMVLFASGRGEALRRFLVDDGVGKDARFWKLAQALSALYPSGTDEKRWVDGVLARKKGLGL